MKSSYIFLIAVGLGLSMSMFLMIHEDFSRPIAYAVYVLVGILFVWATWAAHKESVGTVNVDKIDTWYKHLKTDMDSVFNLVMSYEAGENKEFFDRYPEQAKKVFEAALYWLELVETNQVDEVKKPELEDYYYVGLMYEEGFSVMPNLEMAIGYYKKALTTSACWDGNPKHYQKLRKQVEERMAKLEKNASAD